jgi:competence protein ComEA
MKESKKLLTCFLALALIMAFVPGLWAEETAMININKASVEELSQLKGIGPAYAERIVEYREAHGPFKQAEDIQKIPGIGPKTWEDNQGRISVE